MSFFDDASLVMIPSGYKTSKVYSVKPTDGSGDLAFTRSNDTATRVASNGLIEKVRTNLALYSEQFENAVYTKSQASVTANATTAPNGTTTADKLVEDTSNDIHRILQDSLPYTSGVELTLSVYAKPAGRSKIELRMFDFTSNFASVYFDISAGTIFSTIAGVGTITDAGNGWYRCSITAPASATSANGLALVYLLNAGGADSYTGDGTSGAFLWGFQVERGVRTDYIPTTTAAVSVGPVANVPRLDYLNSSCPRLLLEPQRTNAQTYSEDFSQGKYTKTDCTISSNVTATLDPAGYNGSDKLVEAVSVGGQHYIFFSAQTGANQETQISIFAKAAGRTEFLLWESAITNAQARFNLSNGTISASSSGNASNLVTTTPTITNYGNGWYRCTLNFKTAAGGGTVRVQLYNGSTSYNGNGTDGIYIYGLQEEANTAYATSYIPTTTAAVTRAADAASKTGISSLIGQTEGTMFLDADYIASTGSNYNTLLVLSPTGGLGSGYVVIDRYPDNTVVCEYNQGGIQAKIISATTYGNQRLKIAFAYKANDFVAYVNGVQIGTDNSGTTGLTLSELLMPYIPNAPFGGKIGQALLFKTRLTNAQLAELTTI